MPSLLCRYWRESVCLGILVLYIMRRFVDFKCHQGPSTITVVLWGGLFYIPPCQRSSYIICAWIFLLQYQYDNWWNHLVWIGVQGIFYYDRIADTLFVCCLCPAKQYDIHCWSILERKTFPLNLRQTCSSIYWYIIFKYNLWY